MADSQLWVVGTVAERLPKTRKACRVSRARADDRAASRDGRGTDEEVVAAVEVHVADGGHVVANTLVRQRARLEDAQAGIGRLVALGLSWTESQNESAMNGSCPPRVWGPLGAWSSAAPRD